MNYNSDQLRDWLNERRELISIHALEQRAGVPQSTLQKWLNGKRGLSERNAFRVQRVLSSLQIEAPVQKKMS